MDREQLEKLYRKMDSIRALARESYPLARDNADPLTGSIDLIGNLANDCCEALVKQCMDRSEAMVELQIHGYDLIDLGQRYRWDTQVDGLPYAYHRAGWLMVGEVNKVATKAFLRGMVDLF